MKIGTKISTGFAVVLLLLSAVLGVSVNALSQADSGIAKYEDMAFDTNLAGILQADMLMVRMSVKAFLMTHSEADLNDYQRYFADMLQMLNKASEKAKDPIRATLLSELNQSTDSYKSEFNEVIEYMAKRKAEYEGGLVPHGETMRKSIAEIIQQAELQEDLGLTYHAALVQEKMLTGRLFAVKYYQSGNIYDYNQAIEYIDSALGSEMDQLNQLRVSNDTQALLNAFNQAQADYVNDVEQIHKATVALDGIVNNTLVPRGVEVTEKVEAIKRSLMNDQDTLGPQLKEKTDQSVTLTLTLSAIALVLGVISALLLKNTITRPIQRAVNAANQLAEGNLVIDIGKTSSDETGLLLEAIQNTATNLKAMISTISGASVELASASEELAVVTEQTSQGIIQQESETDMVATAMNEMTTTVHDVANNAAMAADAAKQADDEASSGSKVVGQTISSIHLLSENVSHSAAKLNEVEQSVMNISSILDVIQSIAEQTNLLALNAAIEAARAGEQGRGFAVVADEVRVLAARTQGSTSEIQTLIEQLQDGTQSTVEVMSQSKEQALSCVEQANEANEALQAITNAINVINDMNIQIASASEQQSTVVESINENVINVKRVAEENAAASSQTRSSSGEIAQLADQLNGLVTQFKI